MSDQGKAIGLPSAERDAPAPGCAHKWEPSPKQPSICYCVHCGACDFGDNDTGSVKQLKMKSYNPPFIEMPDGKLVYRTELMAAHERIDELKSVLAEVVGVYWGDSDGEPPQCIQRALAALSEEVRS